MKQTIPAIDDEPDQNVTERLADYLVHSDPVDIPKEVYEEASRTFFNWLGCAIGGSSHPTLDVALEALSEFSGPRRASVIGRSEKLDILHAALVNGISSHVLDFDDTHLETIIHPAEPVVPAILALSERQPVTGRAFLHALILGVETECRIGLAVYPSHYDIGWHITGSTGVFGAAAAAGRLLKLDAQQMTWALGIAATQASGFREMFGTMCKPFHPGKAAQNGLTAALLASKNFTSSSRSIEAERSFGHVTATARDFGKITDGLGESFEITKNSYKPFACGIVIHPTIDACLQLRTEHDIRPSSIESISLKVHPLVLELCGKKAPKLGLEGKFSVYHSAAAALIHGDCGPDQYTDEVVNQPEIVSLRARVTATIDDSIAEDQVHATILLTDGSRLEKFIEHAVGSRERPMGNDALEKKFESLAHRIFTEARVQRLMGQAWTVIDSADVGSIARAASGEKEL